MTINVKAIYIDGVFKPLEPLQLEENQIVSLELTVNQGEPLPPSDFAGLKGIWQGTEDELIEALKTARQTTELKLEEIQNDLK